MKGYMSSSDRGVWGQSLVQTTKVELSLKTHGDEVVKMEANWN